MTHAGSSSQSTRTAPDFLRIDALCDRFETAWSLTPKPAIEDYLVDLGPEEYKFALKELIALERNLLTTDGNEGTLEHYLERFPDNAQLIESVFHPEKPSETPSIDAVAPFLPPVALMESLDSTEPDEGEPGQVTAFRKPALVPDGYKILGVVGKGGMGTVYKAVQLRLNRVVALKMLQVAGTDSPEAIVRFLTEAESIARLRHPNIVQIFDRGDCDGIPYYSMEYFSAGSLSASLDGTPWAARKAAKLVADVARGLAEAHKMGIVHRDIKPANILIDEDGSPRVCDFGLAKLIESDSSLTRTNTIVGTPSYMAPEQTEEGRDRAVVGPAADIYAIGALFYELITGRPPFKGPTTLETLLLVKNSDPVAPSRLVPNIPGDVETIVITCLRKEPSRRYSTAKELADDLDRFLNYQPINARRIGTTEKIARWGRRHPDVALLSTACLTVLVVAILGIVWLWRDAVARKNEAVLAKNEADTARGLALKTTYESQRKSASLLYDRAYELGNRGEVPAALSLLAESLKAVPADDPAFETVVRRSITAWWSTIHRLRHILPHDRAVTAVAVSLDGRVILSGAVESIHRWDAQTGRRLGPIIDVPGSVESIAIHPNGKSFVAGCGNEVRFFDLATGQRFGPTLKHPKAVFRIRISANGEQIVTTCRTNSALVWNTKTGTLVRELKIPNGTTDSAYVFTVGFDHTGKRLVTGTRHENLGLSSTACIWNVETGGPMIPPINHPAAVTSASFSSDGASILTSCVDGHARVWNANTGMQLNRAPMTSPSGKLLEFAAFTPDGHRIITACEDGFGYFWDATTGQSIPGTIRHDGSIWGLAISQDGTMAASASVDTTVRLWDIAPFDLDQPRTENGESPDKKTIEAVFSNDGTKVFQSSEDGHAWVSDSATGRILGTTLNRDQSVGSPILSISPDGNKVAACWTITNKSRIDLMDVSTGKSKSWQLPFKVRCMFFNQDSTRLAVVELGNHAPRVEFYHTEDARPTGLVIRNPSDIWTVAFSPDGRSFATAWSRPPGVLLYNLQNGQPLPSPVPGGGWGARSVVFHPSGMSLSTSKGRTAQIWNLNTLQPIGSPIGPWPDDPEIQYTRDGRWLLAYSTDGKLRAWDSQTAVPAGPSMLHASPIVAVTQDQTGEFLLSRCLDGTAQLWDTATWRPIGPKLRDRTKLTGIAFLAGRNTMLTTSSNPTPRQWTIPEPIKGNPHELTNRIRRESGYTFDTGAQAVPLLPSAWRELPE